jgi:hypothetical protein
MWQRSRAKGGPDGIDLGQVEVDRPAPGIVGLVRLPQPCWS